MIPIIEQLSTNEIISNIKYIKNRPHNNKQRQQQNINLLAEYEAELKKRNVKVCCDKEMLFTKNMQNLLEDSETDEWICLVCGAFETHKKGQLDEEELQNIKDNYGEEEVKA